MTNTMTVRDAYEMGRYVASHKGTQGANDRHILAMSACPWDSTAFNAYWLGRDRHWRMGE